MISHIKLNTVLREFCCENLAELDMYILRKCRVSQIPKKHENIFVYLYGKK